MVGIMTQECCRCKVKLPLDKFAPFKPYKPNVKSKTTHMLACIECTDPAKMKREILSLYSERNQAWFKNEGIFKNCLDESETAPNLVS
jgi:hypothetical protein